MSREITKTNNVEIAKNFYIEKMNINPVVASNYALEVMNYGQVYLQNQNLDKTKTMYALGKVLTQDLSIDPNKKEASLVPYGNALQIIIGKAGYIKSIKKQYPDAKLVVSDIVKGEILQYNPEEKTYQTTTIPFDERMGLEPIGYLATLTFTNGGRELKFQEFMTIKQLEEHRDEYSKNKWKIAKFDAMAEKTVIKRLLSKIAGNINLTELMEIDQSTQDRNGNVEYSDNPSSLDTTGNDYTEEVIDAEEFE